MISKWPNLIPQLLEFGKGIKQKPKMFFDFEDAVESFWCLMKQLGTKKVKLDTAFNSFVMLITVKKPALRLFKKLKFKIEFGHFQDPHADPHKLMNYVNNHPYIIAHSVNKTAKYYIDIEKHLISVSVYRLYNYNTY